MRVDDLIQNGINTISSRLFGLSSITNVKKELLSFQNKRLNDGDQKIKKRLKKFQNDDKSYPSFIKRWSKESRLFQVGTTLEEKVRPPYSFQTHKQSYDKPGLYFQCDLADMKVFDLDRKKVRRNYCIVLVDGVSNKVYLRAARHKNAQEILSGLQYLFQHISRQETVYLQTDKGGEFFNKDFAE